MHDKGIRVPPRSRSEIGAIAWGIRKISGYSSDILIFPIMEFLEYRLPELFPDFCYEVRENGTLKDGARAITYPDKHIILIENSVYDGACQGIGKDRMTISHEVGHLILHTGVSLAKNYEKVDMKIYEDSEWQADVFAGELLAPIRLIKGMCPEEVAEKFQISYYAANAQLRALDKILRCA